MGGQAMNCPYYVAGVKTLFLEKLASTHQIFKKRF
jgi:hypothetical protein